MNGNNETLADLPLRWQREIVALRKMVALELGWDRLRAVQEAIKNYEEKDRGSTTDTR